MQYVFWVAKAIAAFITAGIGAAATYNLDLPPWVMVLASAVLAAIVVFTVPNGDKPDGEAP